MSARRVCPRPGGARASVEMRPPVRRSSRRSAASAHALAASDGVLPAGTRPAAEILAPAAAVGAESCRCCPPAASTAATAAVSASAAAIRRQRERRSLVRVVPSDPLIRSWERSVRGSVAAPPGLASRGRRKTSTRRARPGTAGGHPSRSRHNPSSYHRRRPPGPASGRREQLKGVGHAACGDRHLDVPPAAAPRRGAAGGHHRLQRRGELTARSDRSTRSGTTRVRASSSRTRGHGSSAAR